MKVFQDSLSKHDTKYIRWNMKRQATSTVFAIQWMNDRNKALHEMPARGHGVTSSLGGLSSLLPSRAKLSFYLGLAASQHTVERHSNRRGRESSAILWDRLGQSTR